MPDSDGEDAESFLEDEFDELSDEEADEEEPAADDALRASAAADGTSVSGDGSYSEDASEPASRLASKSSKSASKSSKSASKSSSSDSSVSSSEGEEGPEQPAPGPDEPAAAPPRPQEAGQDGAEPPASAAAPPRLEEAGEDGAEPPAPGADEPTTAPTRPEEAGEDGAKPLAPEADEPAAPPTRPDDAGEDGAELPAPGADEPAAAPPRPEEAGEEGAELPALEADEPAASPPRPEEAGEDGAELPALEADEPAAAPPQPEEPGQDGAEPPAPGADEAAAPPSRRDEAAPREDVGPGAAQELPEPSEPLVARYKVVSAGTLAELPVNAGASRKSAAVAHLAMFSEVEVVEVAEQTDGGRRRARIRSPAGWITLANVSTGTVFAERIDDEVGAGQEAEREAPPSEPREEADPPAGHRSPAVDDARGPPPAAGDAQAPALAKGASTARSSAEAPAASTPPDAAQSGAAAQATGATEAEEDGQPLPAAAAGAPEAPARGPEGQGDGAPLVPKKDSAARLLLKGIRSGRVSAIIDAAEAEQPPSAPAGSGRVSEIIDTAEAAEAGDTGRAPRASSESEAVVPEGLLQAPGEIAASEVEAASSGSASVAAADDPSPAEVGADAYDPGPAEEAEGALPQPAAPEGDVAKAPGPDGDLESRRREFERDNGYTGPWSRGVTASKRPSREISFDVKKEVEHFLGLMREKGDGNTTLAWRRYFDSDGDGNLSFSEFCGALAMFDYRRDALDLWRGLAGDESQVSLEVVDRDGAAICNYFADWCQKVKGGPLEVFRAMDSDESLSLTPQEFLQGLEDLGFFSEEDLIPQLDTEEKVMTSLYPLIDVHAGGLVMCEHMLFLERDKKKSAQIRKEIQRIRELGIEGAPEPLGSRANELLSQLSRGKGMQEYEPSAMLKSSSVSEGSLSAPSRSRPPPRRAADRDGSPRPHGARAGPAASAAGGVARSLSLPRLVGAERAAAFMGAPKAFPSVPEPPMVPATPGRVKEKRRKRAYGQSLLPSLMPAAHPPSLRPRRACPQDRPANFRPDRAEDFLDPTKQQSLLEHYMLNGMA